MEYNYNGIYKKCLVMAKYGLYYTSNNRVSESFTLPSGYNAGEYNILFAPVASAAGYTMVVSNYSISNGKATAILLVVNSNGTLTGIPDNAGVYGTFYLFCYK